MEKLYKILVMMTVFVCAYFLACGQTLERGNYELKGGIQTIQTAQMTIKINYKAGTVTENGRLYLIKDTYSEASKKNITIVKYDETVLVIYFSKNGKYMAHKLYIDHTSIAKREIFCDTCQTIISFTN